MIQERAGRKRFLQNLVAASLGVAMVPSWACRSKTNAADHSEDSTGGSLDKFGIQLYTLRDLMPKDPLGTIRKVSDLGFTQIEGYEGDLGLFWGMPHGDFGSILDDLGLEMISSHCQIFDDFEKKAEQAASIGMKYLICPWIGPQKSRDAWKKVTDQFNECGRICKKNGIRFAYHNHEYTFKSFSGMIPQEFLMENTDPDLVDHQMDIYWVVTGGADPLDFLKRYPNRFTLCHVKDRIKNAPEEEMDASCDLGTGSIDFPSILNVAAQNGMKYYILEQERYDNSTPLQSAAAGARYLKNIVFS